jgi:hypothetical protein
MSLWPKPETVLAAFKGHLTEVIVYTEGGGEVTVRGLRSGLPHVFTMIAGGCAVLCTRCSAHEMIPDPPASMAAGAGRTPLLEPGTRGHALFALTWLNKFASAHVHPDVEVTGDEAQA